MLRSSASFRWLAIGAVTLLTAACSLPDIGLPTTPATRAVTQEAPPDGPGTFKVGEPYQINGQWYHPAVDYSYRETGIASWYGPGFHGNRTANGEIYDQTKLTAAHRTLPMPSMVRVTNLENGRQIDLRVNDRGPFARNRIIDVSARAAELLDFKQQGVARVRVEILEGESRRLAAAAQGGPSVAASGGGSDGSGRVTQASADADAAGVPATTAGTTAGTSGSLPRPDGEVRFTEVEATDIYIQAGAFLQRDNAERLHRRLTRFGDASVQLATVDGRDFFRVRLGPVDSIADADRLLDRVIAQGHREARVVID